MKSMAIEFEKHITKFEINNQCILVEDDSGSDHGVKFDGYDFLVKAGKKEYKANLREFYIKSVFKNGVAFDQKEGTMSDFFFDQSVGEGKRVKFKIDPDAEKIDGRIPIEMEVYIVTKS